MSIGKRLGEAIDYLNKHDYEAALTPTAQLISTTSSRVFPNKRDGDAFKDWLRDNFRFITEVGPGASIGSIHVGFDHPRITPDGNGNCSVEQILYHAVRCGLMHASEFPDTIKFVGENRFSGGGGKVELPASLIAGILVAVIVSPVNANEKAEDRFSIIFKGKAVPCNDLWGNKQAVQDLLDSIKD